MNRSSMLFRGAPLALGGPLLFALALAATLSAEGPDVSTPSLLATARTALAKGDADAVLLASRALKSRPAGAAENLQVSLALFHAGHFDDSARYLRRAAAADLSVIRAETDLAKRMPAKDVLPRLNELAADVGNDADKCFLAGCLLLMHGDRARAVLVLVRAEELSGTDAQAAALAEPGAADRLQLRALLSVRSGEYADAARSFALAALDTPTAAENYAGLALSCAAAGDDAVALRMATLLYVRYRHNRLFPWLEQLGAQPSGLLAAAKRLAKPGAARDHWKLAQLLFALGGYYRSARDAGVQVLLADKLDSFTHDLIGWLDQRNLRDNPGEPAGGTGNGGTGAAEQPDRPDSAPKPPSTVETARKHLRRGDYDAAVRELDALVSEQAPAEVLFLTYVALVGKSELDNAAVALKAWFLLADDDARGKSNAIRELFARAEQFESWRKSLVEARDRDPNSGLIRLLHCYVEISRGRYSNARADLAVAKIENAREPLVLALEKFLSKEGYQADRNAAGVADEPTPIVWQAKGDELFRKGDYTGAKDAYLSALDGDPKLKHLTAALLRVYFALGATDPGQYDNAYRQLVNMLTEQDIDNVEARVFELHIGSIYTDQTELDRHLNALRHYCSKGGRDGNELQRAGPWALLGAIELGRGKYREALDGLAKWHEKDPSLPAPRKALVKLHEYARKRADG